MARVEVDADRRQRIAQGIALLESGVSTRQAELATGIDRVTLMEWRARVAADPDRLKTIEDRIVNAAAAVAQAGMERIGRELEDMDHGKLIAATGMATDKLARYRGWGEQREADPANNALGQALAAIAQAGGTVSLTVTTTPDAIDVTPTEDDE